MDKGCNTFVSLFDYHPIGNLIHNARSQKLSMRLRFENEVFVDITTLLSLWLELQYEWFLCLPVSSIEVFTIRLRCSLLLLDI
jgi:hypothetical protein